MTYAKMDDNWDLSSKLIWAAEILKNDSAHAMFARAIAHCNRELTDGRIRGAVLRSKTFHPKPQTVCDALVTVGVLHLVGDDLYEIHDYLDWNDSREVVLERRNKRSEAGRKGGLNSGESRNNAAQLGLKLETQKRLPEHADTEANAKQEPSKSQASASALLPSCFVNVEPSPLLSSPLREQEQDPPISPLPAEVPGALTLTPSDEPTAKPKTVRRGRGVASRCPTAVDPSAVGWLETQGLPALSSNMGAEIASFLDYHSNSKPKIDWPATWRTWQRNFGTFRQPLIGPAEGHQAAPQSIPEKAPPPPPPWVMESRQDVTVEPDEATKLRFLQNVPPPADHH